MNDEVLERLEAEWDKTVQEENFALASLCSGANRLDSRRRELLLQRQRALLERIASKAAPGQVRGSDCRFGWVHLHNGEVISGVN